MWLYLQKQLATFDTLHMFAKEIDRLKATGGTTLDILYRYYTTRSGYIRTISGRSVNVCAALVDMRHVVTGMRRCKP